MIAIRYFQSTLTVAIMVGFVGCERGPQMCVVSGNVTYRGQPVEQGEIIFADIQQQSPSAAGRIEHGKYEVKGLPGEKRVRITANKPTGKMLEGAMGVKLPELVDILPPQYNSASKLQRTIESRDAMTLDFQLE